MEKQQIERQTPIEIELVINEEGMTTAKKLFEYLELRSENYSRWVKKIEENIFVEEGVDYFLFVLNEERGNFGG